MQRQGLGRSRSPHLPSPTPTLPNSNLNPNPKETISWYLFLLLFSVHFCPTLGALRSGPKSIFILAGQSNMAGRGGVVDNRWDRFVPQQSYPNPSILRLNARLRWVEAKEPLHKDIDTNHTCGVGPGMPFANMLLAKQPALGPIGLVPCAVGGTSISQWARGQLLYTHLLRRTRVALRDGGILQALIWFQGERDTLFWEDAQDYRSRLQKFFSDFRADLQSPLLPIIQVAIESGEGPYIETVREGQLGIDLLNLKTVDAKGLPLEQDHLHLTTPAQVALGQKLTSSFLQFLPTQTQVLPTPVQSNTANIFPNNSFCTCLALICLIALQHC